jgi:VanZ family protein
VFTAPDHPVLARGRHHRVHVPHRLTLLLAYLAFVVYGSLVPLDWRPLPLDQAWLRFQALPFLQLGAESRADWIANGVLYLPLGVLAAQVLGGWLGRWPGALTAWVLCAAVAVGVEFAQLFFPPRTVSLNDLMAEGIGAALGVALAPTVQAWGARLADMARRHPMLWLLGLLQVYAVLYAAMALFPYDLLLSAAEWQGKLAGGNITWTLVTSRGWGLALLRLATEAALVFPLGMLVAFLAGWSGRTALWRGALAGVLLGALVEGAQMALVSGVSQGASVLSRAVGMGLGAALAVLLATMRLAVLRQHAVRWGAWLLVPYLALLLFASGWMRGPWQGLAAATAQLGELRWVPFFYHYYTTEAAALYSLGAVALMYAPLAAWAWARGWRAGPTLGAGLLLALVVETGKLFVAGQRPDPTNLLIVAGTVGLVWQGLQALSTPRAAVPPAPAAARGGDTRPAPGRPGGAPGLALAWLCVASGGLGAALLPAVGLPLAVLLAVVAASVWWRPVLALPWVLAGMPLLDLAPWTGQRWFNEFDLLLAVALGVAAARLASTLQRAPRAMTLPPGPPRWPLFGLWALSLLLAAGLTLAAGGLSAWPGHTAWHSGWTALALLKAALWAWAFAGLCRRLDRAGQDWVPAAAAGLQVGLAGVVAWVLWERHIFVGLTVFDADYRVTGPFSAMHRGGAFIECYLATASAFAVHGLWHARHLALRLVHLALLVGAAYAVMVTFSRNGYAAFALVLLLSTGALLLQGLRGGRRPDGRVAGGHTTLRPPARARAPWAWALAGVLAATAVALPVLSPGGFARERLAASLQDLDVRAAHWRDAIAMRSPGLRHALLGEGLGRFPELHFWRSQEERRAASFQRLAQEARGQSPGPFLRLGPGSTLYVEQVLRLPAQGPLRLQAEVRGRAPGAGVDVALCEKSTLTSARCAIGRLAAPADAAAEQWHTVQVELPVARLDTRGAPLGPQVRLSLLTPRGPGAVDVTGLRLTAPDGRELLANGDFARGLQRWTWTTDVDPPWHVHSLPVHVWLEQGWLGATAWALLLLGALGVAAGALWQGQARVPVALAALAGFMAGGLLNTLVDEPRFLWLLLLYVAWALQRRPDGPPPTFQTLPAGPPRRTTQARSDTSGQGAGAPT